MAIYSRRFSVSVKPVHLHHLCRCRISMYGLQELCLFWILLINYTLILSDMQESCKASYKKSYMSK